MFSIDMSDSLRFRFSTSFSASFPSTGTGMVYSVSTGALMLMLLVIVGIASPSFVAGPFALMSTRTTTREVKPVYTQFFAWDEVAVCVELAAA